MKKLVLTEPFSSKLEKLSVKVSGLTYLGADLSTYKDSTIIAIVGTRKPTPYGKSITEKLVNELARAGVIIISGNAFGIDVLAQSSALDAGGRVITVLPSGLNNIYPASNRSVVQKIIKSGGTAISEYPLDHQPRKVEFLERNRIIAALSDLVIIPEAAANSGSLNTANHAMKLGIPIGVMPGNVTSLMSGGTNHLLKLGANAITEVADIFNLIGIDNKLKQLTLNLIGDTPEETLVLQKIATGHSEPSDLQHQTLLKTVDFQTAVTMLEVQGKIAQDSLGQWRLG